MRSIMHTKEEGTCYLCILLNEDHGQKLTQEHHVLFGRGNRKLSERYGLKVYLCLAHHLHDGGPDAVHRNPKIRKRLDAEAQLAFERAYPDKSFQKIFGKNCLEEDHRQQAMPAPGTGIQTEIQFVEGPVYDLDW